MNIHIFPRKTDRQREMIWKRESERLKKERDSLFARLNSISRYKEDYEHLIAEAKILKERYQDLIAAVENVFEEYKAKLEEL